MRDFLAVVLCVLSSAVVAAQTCGCGRAPCLKAMSASSASWDKVLENVTIDGDVVVPDGQRWLIGRNVQIRGNLRTVAGVIAMRPGSSLKFLGANADEYVGGGMTFAPEFARDIGLWIGSQGVLDISGTPKTGWNRNGVDPTWKPDDELYVSPTAADDYLPKRWFPGNPIPHVDKRVPPAEVMNVTRDIVIEGPAHIHIHSHRPQRIEYLQLRRMGISNKASEGPVLGRYALHLHHGGETTRGTLIRGVAAVDSLGKVFVPHGSHGVTLYDCVSVNSYAEGFWWDIGDRTNDILVDRLCVSGVSMPRSVTGQTNRFDAVVLGGGDNMIIRNSVASGAHGSRSANGFGWPSAVDNKGPAIWEFNQGNVTHNNEGAGIRFWFNDDDAHVVANSITYHNGMGGIENGAYSNSNRYFDTILFQDHLTQQSSSRPQELDGGPVRYERVHIIARIGAAVRIGHHNVHGTNRMEFIGCTFTPALGSPAILAASVTTETPVYARFHHCNLVPDDIFFPTPIPAAIAGTNIIIEHEDGRIWEMTVDVPNNLKIVRLINAALAPFAPRGLHVATASPNEMELRWGDMSYNEDGFEIERNSAGTWNVIAQVVSNVAIYADKAIPKSGKHYYRVRAFNKQGYSEYSNIDEDLTRKGPFAAPTQLAVMSASQTRIELIWKDNSADETGFIVERATNLSGVFSEIGKVADGITNFNSDGLRANTHYAYRVRAFNADGMSSYSNVVEATTSAEAGSTLLLVDFAGTPLLNAYGLGGWHTAFTDIDTEYRYAGPCGATSVSGIIRANNFQGVIGVARTFVAGEKVLVTWYNNSTAPIRFTPKISFTDPDRVSAGTGGKWYAMSTVSVPASGSGTSELIVTAERAGRYALVTVNANYAPNLVAICDKIEIVIPNGPVEDKLSTDHDADGLLDRYELTVGLDPFDVDTDGNLITDDQEFESGSGLTYLQAQEIWLANIDSPGGGNGDGGGVGGPDNGGGGESGGILPPVEMRDFSVQKFSAMLRLSKSASNTCSFSGIIPLGVSLKDLTGSSILIDIGGTMRTFVMNSKGKSIAKSNSLKIKPTKSGSVSLKTVFKGTGLLELKESISVSEGSSMIPIHITIKGTTFMRTITCTYTQKGSITKLNYQ
jgi:hypothetical protein